jgi:hypothetical protein
MLLPAVFGIKSSGLNLAANLMILFLVVIWLALVYWTYADARRRIADQMLVWCATAASVFPFVGTIIYVIVRPPEYLDDVRERELEIQAAEARLSQLGYHLCPYCDAQIEKDFLRCPSCLRKLKEPCRTCGRPLDPSWKICPFCESEVAMGATVPRRTRRRQPTTSERPAIAERREPVTGSREPVRGNREAVREPVRGSREPVRGTRDAGADGRAPLPSRREPAPGRREVAPERSAGEPRIT